MTDESHIGVAASLDDVELAAVPRELAGPQDSGAQAPVSGGLLYEYQTDGRIGGVPVADGDRGLPVGSEDLLYDAFALSRIPRVAVFSMAPGDRGCVEAYEEVLGRIYDGRAAVVDEHVEWDASASRFVVMLRYDELSYSLRPRFAYLREEGR